MALTYFAKLDKYIEDLEEGLNKLITKVDGNYKDIFLRLQML